MYAFNRSRAGPRKSTPANVQCQKCLKRGHYSYECKATPQERPYKARPSRTQQMLNPKLAPKLTNDALDESHTRKKGAADEELAKKGAERARKRERDDDERAPQKPEGKRRRSESVDSISTISTRSSHLPPPRRRASPSLRRARDVSPPVYRPGRSRSRSFDSASNRSRRRSLSPETGYRSRAVARRSTVSRSSSPPPRRGSPHDMSPTRTQPPPRHRGSRDGPRPSRPNPRFGSRSPSPDPRGRGQQAESGYGRYRDRSRSDDRGGRGGSTRGQERPRAPVQSQPEPPRERSLSPFSKRLALTQAMNMGR